MQLHLDSTRFQCAAVGLIALVAAILLLVTTDRWGLGVSYDSVVYVQGSHSLASIPLPQPRDHGNKPLYWWAPIYPLAIRLVGGSYSAARILNAVLLIVGTALIGLVAWRFIGRNTPWIAAALYAFSPALYHVHLNLLAEPLFLVLMVAALALITANRGTSAGLASAAAVLTRYAGLPLFVVGMLFLRRRERAKYLAVSLGCYGAWLIRNEIVTGQTTGRQIRWHPPGWPVLPDGARQLWHLVVTPGRLPSLRYAHAGLIVQVAVFAALLVALASTRSSKPPRLVIVGLTFGLLYSSFIAITVLLFDAETPVDERLLVPVAPPLLLAITWLVRDRPALAIVPVSAFLLGSAQLSRTTSLYGIDYSGRTWSVARIEPGILPSTPLYSNWPAAVAYFTGRSPMRLPTRRDPHTLEANRIYNQQMQQLARELQHGSAALVVLDDSFLEIPTTATPIWQRPDLAGECRLLSPVVHLCFHRHV